MHIYFNMGVKRSVRTSGMQPTILDILRNSLYGQKLIYPDSWFFLCIFQNFLCIFHCICAWWRLSLFTLIVKELAIDIQYNDIQPSNNYFFNFNFFWQTLLTPLGRHFARCGMEQLTLQIISGVKHGEDEALDIAVGYWISRLGTILTQGGINSVDEEAKI